MENSSFPGITALAGHDAWNFSSPGAVGVANPDPKRVEERPLIARLLSLVEQSGTSEETVTAVLQFLARACTATVLDTTGEPDFIQARFAEAVREIQSLVNDELTEGREDAFSFLVVQIFTLLLRLDWLVIGHA
jgi:fructoselysine-6-P-deglycase FrlB-like protein